MDHGHCDPKAGRQLQERTNVPRTDLANGAITSREFLGAQFRAGCGPRIHGNRIAWFR
jgi:hypothetical protein